MGDLWISGEVSNLRSSAAGHNYFTLKDLQSQLRSVMFKTGRGVDLLAEGGLVTAHGRISFYEARGDVQLIADLVMPEGTGPLFLELERLKMRLEEQGLFEISRKRPLPRFPKVVGLVTSPAGAVLDDVRNVIGRRYPLVELLLAPTQVQGDQAARGIVSSIQALNRDGRADVIILARGGGSIEEMWPFNEEPVARAIYASRIPVVSGVGHERDYTIADYVADVRAPTPSAAAELVVPDMIALTQEVLVCGDGILRAMSSRLSALRQEIGSHARRLGTRSPDIDTLRHQVDDLAKNLGDGLLYRLSLWRERINGRQQGLVALYPAAILHRGYAIVEKQAGSHVVSRKGQVGPGEGLNVTVSDGSFPATVGNPVRKGRPSRTPDRAGARLL